MTNAQTLKSIGAAVAIFVLSHNAPTPAASVVASYFAKGEGEYAYSLAAEFGVRVHRHDDACGCNALFSCATHGAK